MNNLSARLANLSPDDRELLMQRLKQKQGARQRTVPVTVVDLHAEATLDPAIKPAINLANGAGSVAVAEIADPRIVLLTGATGFLGAFLLDQLMRYTQAIFYCLVRADSVEEGKRRIQKTLKGYGIWHDRYSDRIYPVLGNLSKPLLGIEPDLWQALAETVDVIYHNAASLNFVYPYAMMKPSNVLGTQEVLRLACQTQVKPVHYTSTFAVFESPFYASQGVDESNTVDHCEGMALGYSQSKWVAEKLIQAAGSRGLPVCIYRLPLISGHSQTGAWNTQDFTCLMIKGCTQMRCWPNLDTEIYLSPVDYVAQAMAYLSTQPTSLGKTFHLNNPHKVRMSNTAHRSRAFGMSFEYLPYDRWQARLLEATRSINHPLATLRPFFLETWSDEGLAIPQLYQRARTPKINCQETLDALAGTSIVCHPLNTALLGTYFSYFLRTGFLDAETLGRSRYFWFRLLLPFYTGYRWLQDFVCQRFSRQV